MKKFLLVTLLLSASTLTLNELHGWGGCCSDCPEKERPCPKDNCSASCCPDKGGTRRCMTGECYKPTCAESGNCGSACDRNNCSPTGPGACCDSKTDKKY